MSEALRDAPPPYGTIVFDCDSTLSAIEGIDELAGARKAEIAELTRRAMDGELALDQVYGKRLELVRPDRAAVEALGARYVATMLPNADLLAKALAALGKRVAIVSGGLKPAVMHLAAKLGVREADVHAVDVSFAPDGSYAGFESASPLARSGGKVEVLSAIARAPKAGAVCFVGDGITDLEAAPAVARFIAFGGVVRREAVFARARVTCAEPDLAALLPHLVLPAELVMIRTKGRFGALVRDAERFLAH